MYDQPFWTPVGTRPQLLVNQTVTVYEDNDGALTADLLDLFTDDSGATPSPNPFNSDSAGNVRFYSEAEWAWVKVGNHAAVRVQVQRPGGVLVPTADSIDNSHIKTGAGIAQSKIAGLVSDLAGKEPSGAYRPGGTDVPVADGGTGASTAAAARTNLGLGNVDNTSDADKPVSTAQGAALDAAISLVGARRVNIFEYGAVADGTAHPLSERYATLPEAQVDYPNAVALTDQIDWQAGVEAILAVEASGGGIVELPPVNVAVGEAYVINKPWSLRERSHIRGSGRASHIKSIGADINGIIFLVGMHHPAHYTSYTYYATSDIVQGDASVTMTTPADAGNFTVGQVVMVRSNESQTNVSGDPIPFFVELNRVTGVNATTGVVEFEHPFDESVPAPRVTDMSGGSFSGLTTFIADQCSVENVSVETDVCWLQRNASYKCWFRNINIVKSIGIVYGNTFSRCLLENIKGNFTRVFVELATGAHATTLRSLSGDYQDVGTDVSTFSLVKFGEHTRDCLLDDYRVSAGGWNGSFGVRVQSRKITASQGRMVAKPTITGVLFEGNDEVYSGVVDLAADNSVDDSRFHFANHQRALDFSSAATDDVEVPKRNRASRNRFYGTPASRSFRGRVGQDNKILDNDFESGTAEMAATFTGNLFRGKVASWSSLANLALNTVVEAPAWGMVPGPVSTWLYVVDPALRQNVRGVGAANRTHYLRRITPAVPISQVMLRVAAQSGNICVAAYAHDAGTNGPGARLATTGSIPCPAVGEQTISFGTTVTPEWLCLSVDNTTASFDVATAVVGAQVSYAAGRNAYQTATFPAPATATVTGFLSGEMFILVGKP